MAGLTDERISHLAHVALRSIKGPVTVRDERLALLETKKVLTHALSGDELDRAARAHIPPRVQEGTPEWDVFYRKALEDERRKRR